VGRKPNTEGLGLDAVGLVFEEERADDRQAQVTRSALIDPNAVLVGGLEDLVVRQVLADAGGVVAAELAPENAHRKAGW